MKRMFKIFAAILMTVSIFLPQQVAAQAPEKMSYQAVVRNSSDELVKNTQVGMRIRIWKGSANNLVIYSETQTSTTNTNGLVSIEIGAGTVISGNFATIDWGSDIYFIEVGIDPSGGTNYSITTTSQLLSVPYALYAKTAETITGEIIETDPVFTAWDKNYADLTNKPTDISDFVMNASSQNITNLANPVNAQDAATKAYVDALLARIEELELSIGFTDNRDGNHYNIVKIGDQIWMAENLKYLPQVVGPATGSETEPHYYVYGYNGTDVTAAKATENYATYGVLYNWTAAMNGAASSTANPSGVQGICPCGWHLPSDAEWSQLEDFLGWEFAGGKLKETGTTHWDSPNTGATNETGFTALPGGIRGTSGAFSYIRTSGYWWTASIIGSTDPIRRSLSYNHSGVFYGNSNKQVGCSVRCLRD